MLTEAPGLQVYAPTNGTSPGRGFYQLEEDTLYVPIGDSSSSPFFSWLESDQVKMDLDRMGRLLLIEVNLPRRRWKIDPDLTMPSNAVSADIRWMDFRETLEPPVIRTNAERSCLRLCFSDHTPTRTFALAEDVTMETDAEDQVVSIWVRSIEDDLAGQEFKRFHLYCRGIGSPSL